MKISLVILTAISLLFSGCVSIGYHQRTVHALEQKYKHDTGAMIERDDRQVDSLQRRLDKCREAK